MRGQARDGRFEVSPGNPLAAATFATKRTTTRYAVAIVIGACVIALVVTGASPAHAEAITQQRFQAIQDECVHEAILVEAPKFKTVQATIARCVAAKQEALFAGLPDLISLMRPYWDAQIGIAKRYDAGKISFGERERELDAALTEHQAAFLRWQKARDVSTHDAAPSQPLPREFTCAIGPGGLLTCR